MLDKKEQQKRILLQMGVITITDINNQIKDYANCMSEEQFDNSIEVKALYDKLSKLIKMENVYI